MLNTIQGVPFVVSADANCILHMPAYLATATVLSNTTKEISLGYIGQTVTSSAASYWKGTGFKHRKGDRISVKNFP